MRKSIANFILTVLLLVAVISWITVVQAVERQKINLAYQFAFPGDLEDQEDETDPTRDNETSLNSDFIMESCSLLQLPLRLKQNDLRQERLFREHHREVGTPPPKL